MALFTIADLHLSLGTNKSMDVFPGWENYVEKLEKNWSAMISPEDTVVLVGDTSWAMKLEDALRDFTFLHELPGKKILLKGNHDYWWSTKTKMEAFFQKNKLDSLRVLHNNAYVVDNCAVCGSRGWLYNAETPEDQKIVAREAGRLDVSIQEAKKTGRQPIAFLHYPPVYDNAICAEILAVLKRHNISHCYFGHIHGVQAARRAALAEYDGIRLHLVSCDSVDFTPVRIEL